MLGDELSVCLCLSLSLKAMYVDTSLCYFSLGMKDSWGPLKALAVASAINGIGDVILCMFLGYGIAGAAWATMASQVRSNKNN